MPRESWPGTGSGSFGQEMTAVRELLFFRDLGENRDDRPALLLIHGDFSDGPGTWDRQMASEKLRAAFRMIVIDRRGAGASPSHPRPYTIRQEAEDALAVLDALKIPSFHVGGHSYGGLIACEVACLVPERVQSLHLIEPPYLSLLPDRSRRLGLAGSDGQRAPPRCPLAGPTDCRSFFHRSHGQGGSPAH